MGMVGMSSSRRSEVAKVSLGPYHELYLVVDEAGQPCVNFAGTESCPCGPHGFPHGAGATRASWPRRIARRSRARNQSSAWRVYDALFGV